MIAASGTNSISQRAGLSFSFLYFLIPKKEKFLVAAGGLGAPPASDAADASDFATCACKHTTQNLENMEMFGIASLKQPRHRILATHTHLTL